MVVPEVGDTVADVVEVFEEEDRGIFRPAGGVADEEEGEDLDVKPEGGFVDVEGCEGAGEGVAGEDPEGGEVGGADCVLEGVAAVGVASVTG